jgi:hypothetical protein
VKIRRKLLGVALFGELSLITQPGIASPGSQTKKAKLKS